MKDYVKATIITLNELLKQHPDADLRYNSKSCNPSCGCKILYNDINYDSLTNTIYIG